MVSQEPAKLSSAFSAVWVRIPVPPPFGDCLSARAVTGRGAPSRI